MPWSYHLHSTITATTQKSKMVAILLKFGVLKHKTYSWGDLLQCYLQNNGSFFLFSDSRSLLILLNIIIALVLYICSESSVSALNFFQKLFRCCSSYHVLYSICTYILFQHSFVHYNIVICEHRCFLSILLLYILQHWL